MSSAAYLTQHDEVVLSSLFDPEAAPGSITIDASLPSDPHITDPKTLSEVQAAEKTIIRSIETCMRSNTPSAEKQATLTQAQSDLVALQQKYQYAGLWNDLAQVLRLQHGDDILFSAAHASTTTLVLSSLQTCITLLTPSISTSLSPRVSPLQARTLSAALLQRGALFNAAAKHLARDPNATCVVEQMQVWGKTGFEERASECFFEAGRLGNDLGRALAVHTNPTAKLCGQMVRDAMKRELGDGVEG